MNIINIKECDAINGAGVRASIWVSGCVNNCKGCYATNTWNPIVGTHYTEMLPKIERILSDKDIDGISLLGGDPLYHYMAYESPHLKDLLNRIKDSRHNLWVWTGYTFEGILDRQLDQHKRTTYNILEYIDVLVDSKFILEKKDLSLKFRGSSNQRIIDVRATLSNSNKEIIELTKYY